MRIPTRSATALGALLAVALLAGCSRATDDEAAPSDGATASGEAVSATDLDIGHVHNVTLDGDAVLLGTHEGLYRQDPGQAPAVVGDPWTGTGIVGATPDGQVLRSTDGGTTWTRAGGVDGQPSGLAASGDPIVVLQGGTLWESGDAGATFAHRITGLPGD